MEASGAPFFFGIGLALAIGAFATFTRFDRERSFYPTILMVIASYYVLFAIMGAEPWVIAWEAAGLILFGAAAVIGFKQNLWIVVAALCSHGGLDAVHEKVLANPGTPGWWPGFCIAFDLTAAIYLAARLLNHTRRLKPNDSFPGSPLSPPALRPACGWQR
jgi:hypothetical protein